MRLWGYQVTHILLLGRLIKGRIGPGERGFQGAWVFYNGKKVTQSPTPLVAAGAFPAINRLWKPRPTPLVAADSLKSSATRRSAPSFCGGRNSQRLKGRARERADC